MESIQELRIGAGSLSIDGRDVGFTTEDGVSVSTEPNVHLHNTGKYGTSPVKATLLGREITLEVAMAQHTFDNITDAYAGAVQADGKIKLGGVAGVELEGKTLVLTPFDGTPSWTFRNAVPTGSTEAHYNTNDERIISVEFTALVDVDAPVDENQVYIS